MKSTTISFIIIGIPLIILFSLAVYSQGYFEVFNPEPKISLTNVTIGSTDITCNVDFKLENSGGADGFAVVEFRFGPAKNLIEQTSYFVKANSIEEKNILTSEIPPPYCNKLQTTLEITRTDKE